MNLRGTLLMPLLLLTVFTGSEALCARGGAPQRKDFREVDGVSKPIYRQRDAIAWKTHGRIVGQISNQPAKFTVSIFIATAKEDGDPYRTDEFIGDISVYETGWLPPGRYRLVIEAEGFAPYTVPEVEVRKGFDCIMDIKFGTHIYHIF